MNESNEQCELFRASLFFSGKRPEIELMYHIPNEGKRSRATGARMNREGLRKGFPDICLPVARGIYHALYIEMKTDKGVLRPAQKEWLYKLQRQGNFTVVCRGYRQALQTLINYLDLNLGQSYENRYPSTQWENWEIRNDITFEG